MKLRASALCYALAAILALPASALAAAQLTVYGNNNNEPYTEAASGVGSNSGTWEWDGPEGDLRLNGYDGGFIEASGGGDLNVVISGENVISTENNWTDLDGALSPGALHCSNGSISISGEEGATLTVAMETNLPCPNYSAIRTSGSGGDRNVVIDGVDVTATMDNNYVDNDDGWIAIFGYSGGVVAVGDVIVACAASTEGRSS